MDTIRILRVVEFVGPRDVVERQIANSLHGEKRLSNGLTIRAATLGIFPDVLTELAFDGLPVVENFGDYTAAEASQ